VEDPDRNSKPEPFDLYMVHSQQPAAGIEEIR
jgi:hypothetical protein